MKALVLFFSLSLPLAAAAQKYQKFPESGTPKTYHVGSEKTPLYRNAADTTGSPRLYVAAGWEITVVGEYSPHWAVVKREGFSYITPARNIANYNSALIAARIAADKAADAAGMPIDPQTKQITYQGVVEVPGVEKNELYRRAYEWVAQTYRSANAVIQMQDKEAGQLIAKGLTDVTTRSIGMTFDAGVVRHTLTIYVKDNKYKYVLTNLEHEARLSTKIKSGGPLENSEVPYGTTKRIWADIKQDANRDAYRLVAELHASMTLEGIKAANDF
jgi:hypothetical protein